MQIKFASPVKGNNKGSCAKSVNYLEKENAQKMELNHESFFSADRDQCNKWEVLQQVDQNAKGQGLKLSEDRFYSLIVAPSPAELAHIGNDSAKLKEYTRDVMENYAANFNKGVQSKDLVWYAKIEQERKYAHTDEAVKAGIAEKGALKQGDQRHIHILISRCAGRENNHVLQAEQAATTAGRTMKLSPLTNQRGESEGAVKSGFNRDNFYRANEQTFDQKFNYERPLSQSYDYCNAIDKGKRQEYNHAVSADRAIRATQSQEQSKSITKTADRSVGL